MKNKVLLSLLTITAVFAFLLVSAVPAAAAPKPPRLWRTESIRVRPRPTQTVSTVINAALPAGTLDGQAGTTLSATIEAASHWTITYGWTIDKSVTPATLDMFRGDSSVVTYTVTLAKDSGTQAAWVDGQVCVTNGGAVATENLAITAVLQNGYEAPNDFLASASVDVSNNPVLDPAEPGCYNYRVEIPIIEGAYPQPHAGGTYKVTANITITNHSGHLGVPFGPSPSNTTTFINTPILVNDQINVDDTNGGSLMFSTGGSVSYAKTFSCDGDEGTKENTATIRETKQSDSAFVAVNCYELQVSKDAAPSYTRTYNWSIDKEAEPSELTLSVGQQFTVTYSLKLEAVYSDSDWAVAGTILVKNPAPIDAVLTDVSDLISADPQDIQAEVACGVDFPYTLTAGDTLTCNYKSNLLPNADPRTNTASATLQNQPSGTTDFTGKADVIFGDPTTEVDQCVEVTDTYAGSLGKVCYKDLPKTFTYARGVGPYATCGEYEVENTADLRVGENLKGSDSVKIPVNVPCGGCTLTQGYWKTHSSYGPAPYDDTWALIGENSLFFQSLKSWYQVFWTPPAGGNVYFILAHQYMAAKLNALNGAPPTPEVANALTYAETFFDTYLPTSKLPKAVRDQAQAAASLLDQYNNGAIGPGHCSE